MEGFTWLVEGRLAGLPRPGSWRALEDDLAFLRDKGVTLLVSLTESPVNADLLARYDISPLHLPVADFTPPTLDQMRRFVDHIRFAQSQGGAAAVHCAAGLGRTGTMLAAWLIAEGRTADEAMAEVRRCRPGSIETIDQERALRDFETALRARR